MLDYSLIAVIVVSIYGESGPAFLLTALLIGAARYLCFPTATASAPGVNLFLLSVLGRVVGRKLPNRHQQRICLSGAGLLLTLVFLYRLLRGTPDREAVILHICFLSRRSVHSVFSGGACLRAEQELLPILAAGGKGLADRAEQRPPAAIKRMAAGGEMFSLLFIDIDYSQRVNDTYGHLAGDVILRDLGRILSGRCRSRDVIPRYGAEEFAALLPGSLARRRWKSPKGSGPGWRPALSD